MSWLYSRALVAEYSAATFSDGERYARSSKTPTPQAFLPPDRMTAFSRPSRFGMTFAPLTESLGKDLLTWFRADSRVRTYPLLETALGSMASDPACGEKCDGSLARYDHATSSWKIVQLSLFEDSDEFSETWPRWGFMRAGECWAVTPSAVLPMAKGYGLSLPRPTASMARKGWGFGAVTNRRYSRQVRQDTLRMLGKAPSPIAIEWLMGWPDGWTDLKPLEMAKFQAWQRQHSPNFQNNKEAA